MAIKMSFKMKVLDSLGPTLSYQMMTIFLVLMEIFLMTPIYLEPSLAVVACPLRRLCPQVMLPLARGEVSRQAQVACNGTQRGLE